MDRQITFKVLEDFNLELFSKAARLHVEHFSYRSFITMFGDKFILELYKDIVKDKLGFFVFAFDGTNVCGFVLGCLNSKKLFGAIKRRFFKYAMIIIPQLLKHPRILSKLLETLSYQKKQSTSVEAELVLIVTDLAYRSSGIGSQLVSNLNAEFFKRGIRQYKVTVHEVMKRSNDFYLKNDMQLTETFDMYNVKWNLYTKQIN